MTEYPDPVPADRAPDPDRPRRRRPAVTTALIVMCVGVYGFGRLWPEVESTLIFAPWLGETQPYRFIGSAFIHADFWHLIFNMYALWLVGNAIEPAFGRWRFIALYALSAIGGNVAVLVLSDPTGVSYFTFVVGASGAVFGLFGALFVLAKRLSRDTTALLILLGINLILGFILEGISWQSHLGGLIVGVVLAFFYVRTNRLWGHIAATAAVAMTLAGTILLNYA
ncbi:rhomboid family intramembrane serine protease [Flaviflexus equikiangi]|uniref:Rhomboid family intramembrane serine protease n=1 Tax=Flaviflexus equikiangi TaxID=2758573 RepID=A0ABS2TC34_9ACTO|nr:rhomboid family intramembrane serine protease [Flaviflexus equikiangi]MBM9432196.1 rhomboid family intramembrane serine protease [Flaviflexus equikiangi]